MNAPSYFSFLLGRCLQNLRLHDEGACLSTTPNMTPTQRALDVEITSKLGLEQHSDLISI